MKYLALALALLLAVGSQAASVQGDAPVIKHCISQVKVYGHKALDHFDIAEKQYYKNKLNESLDNLEKSFNDAVAPLFALLIEQIMDIHSHIIADVDTLFKQQTSNIMHFKEVIEKHSDEYLAKLKSFIEEHIRQNVELKKLFDEIKALVNDLTKMGEINIEETKTAMQPITEAVSIMMSGWLKNIQEVVQLHMAELKEFLRNMLSIA